MSRKIRGWMLFGVMVASVLGLVGCGGGSGSSNARARYFNALIGVAGNSVDFLSPRGGTTIVQANQVAFGAMAPAFGTLLLPIEAGSETFQVFATGTTTPALATVTATVASGTSYVVATSGIVGQANAAAPRLVIVTDTLPNLNTSQAGLRVIHLSPDAPSIDIVNTPNNGQPTPITGLTNLAYGTVSNYATVASGNYNISIRIAGTTTILPTPSSTATIGLVGGKAYTLVTYGLETPGAGQPAFDVRLVADN